MRSTVPDLEGILQTGLPTLIWAGDADWICNWYAGWDTVNNLEYPGAAEFRAKDVQNYTVDGEVLGTFKTAENLSWLRVFGAGHKVPFYGES